MGLLSFFKRSEKRSSPDPRSDFWYGPTMEMLGRSTAGQRVTAQTSQRIAAVYACTTAISETIAMLPATVYREKDAQRKEKLKDHPLQALFHDGPNRWMDAYNFKEAQQSWLLDDGNAYSHISKTKTGKIEQLLPLPSNKTAPRLITGASGLPQELVYDYTAPGGVVQTYPQSEIFHLKYRTQDGFIGRSPVTCAAEVLGFSLALQEHGNSLFENGAFMSGFIKSPNFFKDEESRTQFMDSFKKYMGARKSGGFGLLEGGVEYQPHAMNNRDAQFLEARQFSVYDIARIYRVPPIMIQVAEAGMSYASIEQLALFWVQYTIQPWATRWEQAIKKQLLIENGEQDVYIRFNLDALIRGDLKTRTEAIVQQLQYGLKTINEARALLDENATDSEVGDEIFLSHNMIPASQIMAEPADPTPPGAIPAPMPDDMQPEMDAAEADSGAKKPDTMPMKEPKKPEKRAKSGDFKPLFRSLMGRLVRKEQKAIESAAKKPDFMKRMEAFYREHGAMIEETLAPAFEAAGRDDLCERFGIEYLTARQSQVISEQSDALVSDDSDSWVKHIISMIEV